MHGVDTTVVDKDTLEIKDSVNVLVLNRQLEDFPILQTYIGYKKAMKLYSSYGPKFLKHVNPTTGRVHSSFMQILNTGRTASSEPNCQNIPRDEIYRHCFRTKPGKTFVVADYANQELRILADKANEHAMIRAFKEGKDIHLETAKIMYNNPNLTKKDEERQNAKTVNFTIAYGGGPGKIAKQFGIPISEAKRVIKTYFENFPELEDYLKRAQQFVLDNGYVLINPVTGRKSYIEEYDKYLLYKRHVEYFESCG